MMIFLMMIFGVLCASGVVGQDCQVPGRYCMDDTACCGGCCISNTCINTYGPCIMVEHQCMTHYCPPEMECYIYQPDCEGCAAYPDCRQGEM